MGTVVNKKPKKSKSKYDYIKLAKAKKLTEKELNALMRFMNNSDRGDQDRVLEAWQDNPGYYDEDGVKLDQSQSAKGFKWLKNLGFTPKGKVRSNSPFGAREEYIVQNPKEIRFRDFYDAGNVFSGSYFIPLYMAIGKDGTSMEYYVKGGDVSIVG